MAAAEEDDETRILSHDAPHPEVGSSERHRLWALCAVGALCVVLGIALLYSISMKTRPTPSTPDCATLANSILKEIIGLFPSNRARLLTQFTTGLIYMKGAIERQRNSDTNYQFRQESNFLWLTGVDLVNVSVIIDVAKRNCTLFLPVPDFYAVVFDGLLYSLPSLAQQYQVDLALYWDNMTAFLDEKQEEGVMHFWTFPHVIPPHIDRYNWTHDDVALKKAIDGTRFVKSAQEISLMQLVADVSSDAHEAAMRLSRAGMYEFQVQSIWEAQLSYCGVNRLGYPTILGSGPNGAFLHYELNNRQVINGDMVLVDAGGEFMGYGTDITRTWPVSGVFSKEQRLIYDMVLQTQATAIAALKPGLYWSNITDVAASALCDQLSRNGFVTASNSDCVQYRINYLFMPHGLGHTVGLDVHDVSSTPTTILKEGSVWTVEPGVYFNSFVFENAFANATLASMLVKSKIDSYANFGGVRIEDTLVITATGSLALSSVPKTVKDVERLMKR